MIVNYLVVGLGNHGSQYRNHRHNIGYIVLDALSEELNIQDFFSRDKTNFCALISLKIADKKFFFVKPETYMNNSGISVQQLKKFYKIENENIIIIYDEIDLKNGKCKIGVGGGDNGHNGIKSIDKLCGKDYNKFKIGVGRPDNKEIPISDFVLSDLSNDEIIMAKNIGKIIASDLSRLFDKNGQSIILNKISKNRIE